MRRRTVEFRWEDPDAQAVFAELCEFPGEKQTAQEVDRIEALLGIRPPLRILDVGCGNGRHAIELARRSYEVVGIDIAERFLDEARRAAAGLTRKPEFRFQRAEQITETEAYDLVLATN